MNIRPATPDDVDAIVSMSAKFYETTSYRDFTPMSEETVSDLVLMLIDDGVMLIAECDSRIVGMAGLVVAPFMFNGTANAAYEVVWWVNPDQRDNGVGKRLMSEIDVACREKGCAIIQMVTLSSSPAHAGKIYEALGYQHSETCYTKVL